MTALRIRLFVLVLGVTMLVWAGAAGWTSFSTRAEVERVLDGRLIEAARMVAALDVPASGPARRLAPAPYSRQLSCQIWSLDGALVGQSAGAPDAPLAAGAPGLSSRQIGDEQWRVYTHVDAARGIRVMVGDSLAVRQHLVNDLMLGLLLPAAVGLVALAMLLWFGVRSGLSPLARIARAIELRSPQSLEPLAVDPVPEELRPLVQAMDDLLNRLEAARRAERDFVANAAHELQTPLAGLKTQAEVARRATDPAMRDHALERIAISVDRTSRLVRQLLELARQEGREAEPANRFAHVNDVVSGVASDYAHLAAASDRPIVTSCTLRNVELAIDAEALRLALGNLVENALQHGSSGPVRIECAANDGLELRIIDGGAGIAADEVERVRRRFERGPRAMSGGTGLGLSIVEAAIAPAQGVLEFRMNDAGFAAVLRFPSHRVRKSSNGAN
ncbi:ATP-binding protein [Sphingobium sp. UBA5915]|uniref:ATP-binding protein n=1 Tax=Sphingobium sp. UBA5915 TaxID=1947530 RepID=UPI0025F137FF|nr:ATP-binding protein [Sphingobium sp. UBA5915]